MSSNLLEFQAEEKSNRAAFGVQGGFGPKAKGSIGLDVGTSGKYKPIDADIEIPDRDTKNASENVGVGVQVRAGGTGGHHTEGDSDGKGTKHRRDSSSSSSSSSSSDEEGNQDKTSKAKRKKKRKGILSGSFLPKFGTSKKSNKGKGDDAGRMAAPEKVELGLDVSPSSRKLERPQSTEIEIQTDLGMEAACEGNNGESGTQADPDVEIFHGIGADAPKDDYTGVTVTASGVEKFPAPALGTVSGDGTDVDLGLSAKFGEERDDSTSENMDTSDLLSQVENAIKSMEAAAHEQKPDIAMPVISAGDDEPIRRGHGDVHLNSADIAAVNVDSDPTLHVQLAKPKEGPILELPEGDAELSNSHISIEHVAPNVPSQADLETGRHSSTSSSRSSQGEQKQQSKGILPSIKFQLPKFGGKKSKNTDGDANSELDGSISVQSDLVTSRYDGDRRIDSPQSVLDTSLPDVDTNGSSDIHVNTSIDTTFGSKVDPEVGIGSESDVSHLSPQKKEESDDNSDIDAYLGAAAIDVGLPVPVDMDFDASVDTAGTMDMEVPAKPKSKKTKRKLPKLRFGSKKNEKVDLPSADVNLTTETPTFEVDTGGDNERPDAAFEVVGKRASLKKNVELPCEEAPVAPMVESNVESLPAKVEVDGHSLPEININLSHPGTGIDDKEKYLNQDAGFGVNGGLNEERGAALEMDVQYEWPNREAEGDHSDVALQAEGDVDVDGSSDIEAYIGVSSPSDTFLAGVTAVGPTIQGPDSSSKSSFQYSKGKMSKKGTRNLPKVKTKGNRNAFSGKTKKPDDRIDVKVESKGTGSDMKMEIHPHNLDVADPVKPVPRRSSGEVKASSSEPNLVFNDDSKHKRKGFTLPRLKMPKFKKSGRKSSQDKTVGDSFDLEVGGKRSSSLPDISYSTSSDGGGNASSYLDTSNKRKKRWSTGFRFPNFGFPKFSGKQRPQSEADRSGFDEVDVSVSNPDVRAGISIDVDTLPDDVFPGDDGPKEKTPKGDISFNNGVPDLGTNEDTTLPEVRVHVDHGGDAKVLDWQQQKSDDIDKNITIPSIEHKDDNVVSPEMEVKMNMVEEVSSAPVEVHKSDAGFKSGISGGVQIAPVRARDEEFGDADIAAQVEGDVTFSGVDFTHKGDPDVVSITSSSSESEKHSAKKKRGLFGGIHFPKFKGKSSSKKHIGTGVSFDDGEMEVDLDEKGPKPEFHAEISTPEFDLRPSISTDDSHPKVEAEVDISVENVRSDGDTNVHIPEFELSNRDTDVDGPSGNVEVNVNLSGASDGDINIPRDNVDVDGRGAITLPAIGIKEKYDDNRSVSSTSSSSSVSDKASDKTNKKRGLFGGFHLPKFKGKGSPKKEIGTGVSFDGDNDMEVDIELPRGGVDLNYEGDAFVPNVSVDQTAVKPELDVSANEPAVQLPEAAISADHPDGETELNVPGFPGTALGDVDKPSGTIHHKTDVDASIDMNIPKPEVSSSVEVDLPEGDINTQIPGIGVDVDVSDKVEGQINVPDKDTGLDIDAEGEINLHRFDVNVKGDGDNKSVTSSSSSSSSESEKTKKKKKGFFGGIHLPKFKGKGSRKKEIGTGVSFDGDNDMEVDIELPRGGVDLNYEGDVSVPNVSLDQNAVKPELDVSVNEPAVELPEAAISADRPAIDAGVNLSVDVPTASVEVDIPTDSLDTTILGGKKETGTGITASKPDVDLPNVNLDASGDVEIPSITGARDDVLDVDREGSVRLPATTVDIDVSGDIRIPRFRKEGNLEDDRKSISSTSSSSSSESEKNVQKKKGLFSGFHLPKFMGKGPKVKGPKASGDIRGEFPGAKVDVDAGGDLAVATDVHTPHVSVDEKVSGPKFDVGMSSDAKKPDLSAGISVPVAGAEDLPAVKVKLDADLPTPDVESVVSIDNRHPEIDRKDEFSPSMQKDLVAVGGIGFPKHDSKGSEDDKESISSSSSSSDNEKVKKGGKVGSLAMPAFKGNVSPDNNFTKDLNVNFDGDIDLAGPEMPSLVEGHGLDAEVASSGDVDLNVNIPKPSGESPEVNVNLDIKDKDRTVHVGNPDIAGDFKLSGPTPELDVVGGADVSIPGNEASVDGTIPNREIDALSPSLDLKGADSIEINPPDGEAKVTLVRNDPHLDITEDGKPNVNLPAGDISTEADFQVSDVSVGEIPKKETKNVRFPDVDLVVKDSDSSSDTSSSSDSDGDDKKKKKGFFGSLHFPKFKGKGPKQKTGVKGGRKGDVTLDLDKHGDGLSDDHNLRGGVEIPDVDGTMSNEVDVSVKEKKYDPTADITSDAKSGSRDPMGIDIGEPDVDISLSIPKTSVDSDINVDLVPDVDPTIGGARDQGEVDVEGSVKLPEIETGDAHHPGPEVDVNLPLVKPDAHMELDVDVGKDDSDVPNMKDAHIDSVDTDVKVKGGINAHVDPSLPEGGLELPGLKTEKEIDDETSSSSSSSESDDSVKGPEDDHRKKKGFLPSFHLPKIHFKRPKSPDKKKGRSAASVEVELKVDVDVPDTDIGGAVTTGPDLWDSSVGVSDPDGAMKLQVDEPEVAVSTAKPEKPEIDLDRLGQQLDTSFNVSADFPTDANADVAPSVDSNIEVLAPGANNDSTVADTPTEEEHEITFEKFGKLLAESEQFDASDSDNSEADSKERDADVVAEIDLQADIKVNASQPERKLDLDVDWTQLGLDMSDEEGEPSAHINAGQSLTRSSSKSSLSSSTSEEEKKPKKTKGFLPSLKLSKFTGGKSQEPTAKVKGDGIGEISGGVEGKVSPSVNVDVELSPHSGSPREVKSPKGRLGLFKRGRGKKGDSPQSPQQEVAIPEVSVSLESTPQRLAASSPPPKSDVAPPNTLDLSGAVATHSMPTTPVATAPSTPQSHFSVVVAIDFGTTFSGYAYSFTHDPENIHVMRKCEGGDPGVVNMKILTTLLMTPEGEFHSFGFTARDFYHDMKFAEAQRWLYFDKYKLALNDHKNLNIDTELTASNGTKVKALTVFEQTLRYFKDRFLEELMDLSMDGTTIDEEDIRWVLTVPAIWRQPAKQFMRQAAYKAGIASPARPAQLMIALEPEAASIYIGKLTMRQLMPERMALRRERWLRGSMGKGNDPDLSVIEDMNQGSRYVVVDCGGGTVDITVHEVEKETGTLKELHKASGGMFGSGNVDDAFIKLMVDIFGSEFIEEFKIMRPAGWVDLLIAFEARKRNANPWKANFLNVSLPFSFIDYYKKFTNGNLTVEQTLSDYNDPEVKWSGHSPGMLRFSPEGMSRLFTPTTSQLLSMLDKVLAIPELEGISHLFLAGGFAESPLLQNKIRDRYKDTLKVVIPQDVGLATMKGAVMFGQNPGAVSMRRARLTYGVGALNKFDPKIHPEEKKIVKDGMQWCRDVFDIFVHADQSVSAGEKVTRSYAPASSEQEAIKINIYCSENDDARFITDDQVRKCGTLTINLGGKHKNTKRRELQLSMQFGDTEMRVDALDVSTGKKVEAKVDFLNN